jgi:hypothetical protein
VRPRRTWGMASGSRAARGRLPRRSPRRSRTRPTTGVGGHRRPCHFLLGATGYAGLSPTDCRAISARWPASSSQLPPRSLNTPPPPPCARSRRSRPWSPAASTPACGWQGRARVGSGPSLRWRSTTATMGGECSRGPPRSCWPRRTIPVPTGGVQSPLHACGRGEVEIATAWLRQGLRLCACEEVTRWARQRGANAGSGASGPPGRSSTNGRSTRPSKSAQEEAPERYRPTHAPSLREPSDLSIHPGMPR